ncbi:MAG TPA: glycosyltransferase family 39 protein [Ilumatobacteraceae bacterium]|nr:glycosyltransferase family 39 protein [Ilumatobacteraceae bacterium]
MEPSVIAPHASTVAPAGATRVERARAWLDGHRALAAVVAVAFVLRLTWVLWWQPSAPIHWQLSGDQFSYYHYAREIAAGRGYVHYVTGEPTAYYPIGYPAILAALFFVVGHTPVPDDYMMAVNVLHVAVGTASVVLAYLVGRALFGERGGLAGAALVAVFPNLVYQVTSIQLETMYIFWCLAAVAILVTHDWSRGLPSTRRLVAFGAVLGVSVLIRPFSIWFVVALFAGAVVAGAGWRRSVRAALIPLGVVLLMMVPWTIRNAVRLDAFVPTSTNTGDTLCLDRSMDATGGFRWADHEGCADPDLPEVERNSENTRMAVRWVLDHPAREVEQIVRRTKLIFASDTDGITAVNTLGGGAVMADSTADVLEVLANAGWLVICLLATAGVVILLARRRHEPATAIVLVSLASLIVIPMLLWGNPRFHLPFSPFLAILAGGAIGTLLDALRRPGGEHRHDEAHSGEGAETVQPLEA